MELEWKLCGAFQLPMEPDPEVGLRFVLEVEVDGKVLIRLMTQVEAYLFFVVDAQKILMLPQWPQLGVANLPDLNQ